MTYSEGRSRRRAAGICLIAGPGLVLAGAAIFPSLAADQEDWVADIAAAGTRGAAGSALVIVGLALSVLAYMALVHLLREHRPLAGDIGGALAIVGAALMTGLLGMSLAEVEVIRHLGSSAETAAVIDAIDESPAAIVMFVGTLLLPLGLVVLSIALARARTTPPLVAGLLGVGAVVFFVGNFGFLPLLIAGSAAMFVATALIGMQLLAETDREWEHVPQFRGFHRAASAA